MWPELRQLKKSVMKRILNRGKFPPWILILLPHPFLNSDPRRRKPRKTSILWMVEWFPLHIPNPVQYLCFLLWIPKWSGHENWSIELDGLILLSSQQSENLPRPGQIRLMAMAVFWGCRKDGLENIRLSRCASHSYKVDTQGKSECILHSFLLPF